MPIIGSMKQVFNTSVGTVHVVLDRNSRTVSVTRFNDEGRAMAAAIESWDFVDLLDVLNRQVGIPLSDASRITAAVREQYTSSDSLAERLNERTRTAPHDPGFGRENAGVSLRFVAVLIDTFLVLFPLSLLVGLLSGGGYAVSGDGYANAGTTVSGNALWLLLGLCLAYYVLFEAMTGATLGKHMVGIRVVGENGRHPSLGAAIGRNLLRLIDGLFFYLVGGLFALTSPHGQRLGDRAANTFVIRR